MFTDQLGRAVRRADGTRIGKVDDLIVVLGETDPYVVALRVRVGRRSRRRVPWSAVASVSEEVVITADPIEDELAGDELLLARDVLDTQIFELGGRRLTRVADIELVWRDRELRVVGVDIGAAPLLRRLGLGVFARRAASKVIPWNELHLTSVRGHEVQLETPTSRVYTLTEEELAELGARLPPHARSRLYARIRPHAAARARELEAGVPESQSASPLRARPSIPSPCSVVARCSYSSPWSDRALGRALGRRRTRHHHVLDPRRRLRLRAPVGPQPRDARAHPLPRARCAHGCRHRTGADRSHA